MKAAPFDQRLEFLFKFTGRRLRPSNVRPGAANIFIAARHVLPDEQSKFVAPIVPTVRLDLDVLARQVEAELFGHFDVVAQRLVGGRGVKAIRPEALIQRSELKIGLIIKAQSRESFVIFAEGNLPQTEVAFHLIDGATPQLKGDYQV